MKRIRDKFLQPAFLALLPLLCAVLIGWADDLGGLKQEMAFVASIRADFVQEKHIEILDKPLISKGKLYFRAPRSLRWEYTHPVRSVLLMHNDRIRRYVETDAGMKAQKSQGLEAMRVFLEEISMWMQGEFQANPDLKACMAPGQKVVLTPTDPAMAEIIKRIELKLTNAPGIIDFVAIHESADSYTRIRFRDTKINREIGKAVFRQLNFEQDKQ